MWGYKKLQGAPKTCNGRKKGRKGRKSFKKVYSVGAPKISAGGAEW